MNQGIFLLGVFVFIFILTGFLTRLVREFALKNNITDDARSNPERKKQRSPVPLLGGTAGMISGLVGAGVLSIATYFGVLDFSLGVDVEFSTLCWLSISLIIFIVGGYLDDKYNLSPKYQILFINAALIIAVFVAGIRIEAFSPPFSDILPDWRYLPELLAYTWLGFCIAATKFLDGHDGLVVSVGIVGLLTIASVSLFGFINQPFLAIVAFIFIISFLPFLKDNFPNARSYLGEGGSEFIGFLIGVLAIFSGAKVATAMSVVGWFIFDLLFVWFLRVLDKRNPITSADRLHWHFRLLDTGMSKIQVLVITTLIILITAHSALILTTGDKMWLLFGQGVFLLLVFIVTSFFVNRRR